MRPSLGGEDRGHRLGIGGIRAEPVHRLGAEGDQFTCRQQKRRRCDILVRA